MDGAPDGLLFKASLKRDCFKWGHPLVVEWEVGGFGQISVWGIFFFPLIASFHTTYIVGMLVCTTYKRIEYL